MKFNNIFFLAALLSLTMFTTSCKDDDNDNAEIENGITAEEAEQAPCTHSLIHIDAQAPTGEENGCIEHYECEYCGTTFSDAAGQNAFDNIIIWATNYADPEESPMFDNAGEYEDNGKFAEYADGEFITNNLVTTKEKLKLRIGDLKELQEFAEDGSTYRRQILTEAVRLPDFHYNQTLTELREKQNSIADATDEAFVKLMHFALDIMYDRADAKLDSIQAIYIEWGLQTHSHLSDSANAIFHQYTTFQGNDSLKSYPAYYDYVAMHSPDVLWEHQSYQLRENARAADAILMCEYYTLIAVEKCLFHSDQVFEADIIDLNTKMTRFAQVLKDNPIEYHRDVLISYIPGLNMTFKKALKTVNIWEIIYNHRDTKYCWTMYGTDIGLRDVLKDINNEGLISQGVYKTIYYYYKFRYGNANIYDILSKVGFTNIGDQLVTNRQYDPNEHIVTEYDRKCIFHWNMFRWQNGNLKNEDWLGVRTCLNNHCNLCYTNVIVDADIDRNNGTIKNMGTRCNVTFCALAEAK